MATANSLPSWLPGEGWWEDKTAPYPNRWYCWTVDGSDMQPCACVIETNRLGRAFSVHFFDWGVTLDLYRGESENEAARAAQTAIDNTKASIERDEARRAAE